LLRSLFTAAKGLKQEHADGDGRWVPCLGLLLLLTAALVTAGCNRDERTFRIVSSSMEPTLHCARPAPGCRAEESDRIRVRAVRRIERGDIVVIEFPKIAEERCGSEGEHVIRVIGLPGETVRLRDASVSMRATRGRGACFLASESWAR